MNKNGNKSETFAEFCYGTASFLRRFFIPRLEYKMRVIERRY
jgi:hypothetical protein